MSFRFEFPRHSAPALLVCLLAAVAAASAQSPTIKTIWVAHFRADCVGVGPRKCLLVKEEQFSPWELYYGEIEGFEYLEGYAYHLRVSEERVADPSADGSAIRLRLLEVIDRLDSMDEPQVVDTEVEPQPASRRTADTVTPPAAASTPGPTESLPAAAAPSARGLLSSGLGPETRAFRPCGAREEVWVVDQTGGELWQRYRELAGAPNQPVYVEIEGRLEPAPQEGFGANYEQQLVVTRVVRAEAGRAGCEK